MAREFGNAIKTDDNSEEEVSINLPICFRQVEAVADIARRLSPYA